MENERKQKTTRADDDFMTKQNSLERITEQACPQCRHVNDSGAFFCEECGTSLQKPATCPKCNATARIRADICEICGTWLLKGQCMFCYAPIADDEAFCGECGNPSEGIVCQICGKLSIFDFCKTCGIPLSAQAKEMLRKTTADPAFKDMSSFFKEFVNIGASSAKPENDPANITSAPYPNTSIQDDHALRLKSYREASNKLVAEYIPKPAPKALFSGEQKARINRLNEEVFQEEERCRIEEERRRQEEERKRRKAEEQRRKEKERRKQETKRKQEEERRLQEHFNEAMRRFNGKTFSSSQKARRFFMAMIAGLPEEVSKKITNRGLGWRCNAYDCVHNSPSECSDPSRGGVWLIR